MSRRKDSAAQDKNRFASFASYDLSSDASLVLSDADDEQYSDETDWNTDASVIDKVALDETLQGQVVPVEMDPALERAYASDKKLEFESTHPCALPSPFRLGPSPVITTHDHDGLYHPNGSGTSLRTLHPLHDTPLTTATRETPLFLTVRYSIYRVVAAHDATASIPLQFSEASLWAEVLAEHAFNNPSRRLVLDAIRVPHACAVRDTNHADEPKIHTDYLKVPLLENRVLQTSPHVGETPQSVAYAICNARLLPDIERQYSALPAEPYLIILYPELPSADLKRAKAYDTHHSAWFDAKNKARIESRSIIPNDEMADVVCQSAASSNKCLGFWATRDPTNKCWANPVPMTLATLTPRHFLDALQTVSSSSAQSCTASANVLRFYNGMTDLARRKMYPIRVAAFDTLSSIKVAKKQLLKHGMLACLLCRCWRMCAPYWIANTPPLDSSRKRSMPKQPAGLLTESLKRLLHTCTSNRNALESTVESITHILSSSRFVNRSPLPAILDEWSVIAKIADSERSESSGLGLDDRPSPSLVSCLVAQHASLVQLDRAHQIDPERLVFRSEPANPTLSNVGPLCNTSVLVAGKFHTVVDGLLTRRTIDDGQNADGPQKPTPVAIKFVDMRTVVDQFRLSGVPSKKQPIQIVQSAVEQIKNEAQMFALLPSRHPNLVEYRGWFMSGSCLGLVTEKMPFSMSLVLGATDVIFALLGEKVQCLALYDNRPGSKVDMACALTDLLTSPDALERVRLVLRTKHDEGQPPRLKSNACHVFLLTCRLVALVRCVLVPFIDLYRGTDLITCLLLLRLKLLGDACKGIGALHDVGLVHRDLKASNMTIGYDGTLKLLDLGFATCMSKNVLDGTHGNRAHQPKDFGGPTMYNYDNTACDVYAMGLMIDQVIQQVRVVNIQFARCEGYANNARAFYSKSVLDECTRAQDRLQMDALALVLQSRDLFSLRSEIARSCTLCPTLQRLLERSPTESVAQAIKASVTAAPEQLGGDDEWPTFTVPLPNGQRISVGQLTNQLYDQSLVATTWTLATQPPRHDDLVARAPTIYNMGQVIADLSEILRTGNVH